MVCTAPVDVCTLCASPDVSRTYYDSDLNTCIYALFNDLCDLSHKVEVVNTAVLVIVSECLARNFNKNPFVDRTIHNLILLENIFVKIIVLLFTVLVNKNL